MEISILSEYSMKYRIVWKMCMVLQCLSSGILLAHQACYSEVVGSDVLRGVPWTVEGMDQQMPDIPYTSQFCNSTFDAFNPAMVDAIVIALPTSCLLIVSFLLQACLPRQRTKLPELTVIGLMFMAVAVGCMMKSTHLNRQLIDASYSVAQPVLTQLFIICYGLTFIATAASVIMLWPQPVTGVSGRLSAAEVGSVNDEIPLRDMQAAEGGLDEDAGVQPSEDPPAAADDEPEDVLTGLL